MQIASTTLYDISSSITIRLNDKEVLVIDEDPESKRRVEAAEDRNEQKKLQRASQKSEQSEAQEELSPDEEKLLKELAARDTEVKAHEAAHQAAGGGMTGAASYTYQQGPDGKMYAIGGEVSISTPISSTPEEALQNARIVAASALAAGSPSPQDSSVASSAKIMEMKALQEISKKTQEEIEGSESYKDASSQKESREALPSLDISA